MINLNSDKWAEIQDAYRDGKKVAALLEQIQADPSPSKAINDDEPWYSLWSSICHQGTVYPASFAAVPHLADIASHTSYPFDPNFFFLPAFIEIERVRKNVEVPTELKDEYYAGIKQLAELASHSLGYEQLTPDFLQAARGMVLVGEGKHAEARKILDPEGPESE
jgi:hypothetical protein